jgi:serine/threonine-protein kinase
VEQQNSLVGTTIQNRYQILRLIGKGGMGVVYEGKHLSVERKVAIKLIHSSIAADTENVGRFYREAQTAAAARHEHIIEVFDMDVLPDGSPFMVQEYLEGSDLGKLVENEGPLPLGRVARIMVQACDGLDAVHAAGIIHRDLKPENIFLISRGANPDFVKIMDFGISKIKTTFTEDPRFTAPGTTIGTPLFMAPEQITASAAIDKRADVFALGGLLYYSLTANYPFTGETLYEIWEKICNQICIPVRRLRPDLPSNIEGIICKALEKEPSDRYSSCAELKAALWPHLDQSPELISAAPDSISVSVHAGKCSPTRGQTRERLGSSLFDMGAVKRKSPTVRAWLGGTALAATGVALVTYYLANRPPSIGTIKHVPSTIHVAKPKENPFSRLVQDQAAIRASSTTVRVSILATPQAAKLFLDGHLIENPYHDNFPISNDIREVKAVLKGKTEIRDFVADKEVFIRIDLQKKSALGFAYNGSKKPHLSSEVKLKEMPTGQVSEIEPQALTLNEVIGKPDQKSVTGLGDTVSRSIESDRSTDQSRQNNELGSSRRTPILIREE